MTRLIDGDALIELINGGYDLDFDEVPETKRELLRMIMEQPTVDAVPVKHGKWITKSTGGEYFDCCSECGYVEWDAPNKYCPNCGARMDEE